MRAVRSLRRGFGRGMLGGTLVIASGAILVWLGWAWGTAKFTDAKFTDDRGDRSLADARGGAADPNGGLVNSPAASSLVSPNEGSAASQLDLGGDSAERTHDFGVVPPGAVVNWAFPVRNTSDFAWTIDKVEVLCRCTVPSISSPVIAPGMQEEVTVELDCGSDVADIVKSAVVRFEEADAAPVKFLIKASVRAPMTPGVREVSFAGLAKGDTAEQAITLSNYSGADWRALRVESCPPWAEVVVLPYRDPSRNVQGEPQSPRAPEPQSPRAPEPQTDLARHG